jgi:hypothetical protein
VRNPAYITVFTRDHTAMFRRRFVVYLLAQRYRVSVVGCRVERMWWLEIACICLQDGPSVSPCYFPDKPEDSSVVCAGNGD